jgi:integrase
MLFQALAEEKNTIAKDYILISLLTGARKNNVLSMRWNEIDFRSKTWRIPETKNGEPLTVPLTEQAVDILLNRKTLNSLASSSNAFVFPGSGKDGHLADPKKPWKMILINATIKLWQLDKALSLLVDKAKTKKHHDNKQLYKAITQLAAKEKIAPA